MKKRKRWQTFSGPVLCVSVLFWIYCFVLFRFVCIFCSLTWFYHLSYAQYQTFKPYIVIDPALHRSHLPEDRWERWDKYSLHSFGRFWASVMLLCLCVCPAKYLLVRFFVSFQPLTTISVSFCEVFFCCSSATNASTLTQVKTTSCMPMFGC